ncbi:DUF4435 domain-containing protein [Roseibium aggregatum]|uniref:DUF4435 domain-containing protein n=1 Tax=Roseibium aggregatum TaxID=187304 RepID=A0A0M6Y6T4_9HYPH|nr:DUF4435 domain-containing protein [Roseibium aggregatum]CTQ44520.1 hypothetical protein LAL4801_02964 [Roseibium aggregatum]
MTLRRSASALYSINIFYQVDVVVFCEGGEPLSYDQAISRSHSDGTLDSLYWETIIDCYDFQKKYHIKSVGSKGTLVRIAEDVRDLNIESISICMDSDYERIQATNYDGPRVAWTMGYSWENDVVSPPVLENILSMLMGAGTQGIAARRDLQERVSKLEQELQRWTEIDISLCARGKCGIFDREKPLAAIDMSDPPRARQAALTQRLAAAGYQRKPRKVVSVRSGDVGIVCFGKLISRALYHSIVAILRSVVATLRLDYELFMRIAISETIKAAKAKKLPDFLDHIQSQREAFV